MNGHQRDRVGRPRSFDSVDRLDRVVSQMIACLAHGAEPNIAVPHVDKASPILGVLSRVEVSVLATCLRLYLGRLPECVGEQRYCQERSDVQEYSYGSMLHEISPSIGNCDCLGAQGRWGDDSKKRRVSKLRVDSGGLLASLPA